MKTISLDEKIKSLNELSTQLINLTITINDLKQQQQAIIEHFKELHQEVAKEVQNSCDSDSTHTDNFENI